MSNQPENEVPLSIFGMTNVIKHDRELIFEASSSVRTIADMLYNDLLKSETSDDETMSGMQKEGLLKALCLISDQLSHRYSELNEMTFQDN